MPDKIPKGWKRIKLGDVLEFENGKSRPEQNGNIPIYGGNGILGYCNNFNSNGEAIIIGRVGAYCGSVFFEKRTIWVSDNALLTKPIIKKNTKYFYYLLKNLKLNKYALGSSQPLITQTLLKSIEAIIPLDEKEQHAIASILSSLDDKIDLLYRENKTLEQMAQAIFRKWFIEDAKDDWEEKPLKDIYLFEKGFEPGSKNYFEEKTTNAIRFIRVGDMLNPNASIYIDKNLAVKTCKEDDLLVSFDGTVGRAVFGIQGAYSSGIRKILSDNPIYNNLGLKYLIFTSKDIQDLIKSHATGTVILHASSSINHLSFAFPPENIIKRFNSTISPLFDKILRDKIQIRILEQLRDTLLPKLMSGEVRVKV